MSNAPKSTLLLTAALTLMLLLSACGGNSRQEAATTLLEQARSAAAEKHYSQAIALLDTLDKSYRDCLDQRRQGTRLRTEALRDLTLDSIAINDALLTTLQTRADSLQAQFSRVEVPGTQGYQVLASEQKAWNLNRTGIQARLDPEGYFFIAVNYVGRPIGLYALGADGAQSARSASVAVEGSEIMNVSQEAAVPLVDALSKAQAPVKMTLLGTKGKASITLDARQLAAINATWEFARTRQQLRFNLIRRERLERQLSRLRDALVNLPTDSSTAEAN